VLPDSTENKKDCSSGTGISPEVFWRVSFTQPAELVVLPFDRPRPPVPSYLRETAELTLRPSAAEGLCGLSARLAVSPLAILLAAVQTVLFRYGGQHSFVVGAVSQIIEPDDQAPSTEMPLWPIHASASFSGEVKGRELILELARRLTEAQAHAAYPLRELQSWAGAFDAAFGRRLFNVALCLADFDQPLSGWPLSDSGISEFLTQCDVAVVVVRTSGGVSLRADFDSELFEKATVERLLSHIAMILEGMTGDPSIPVLSLPILTPHERQTLLVDWNSGSLSDSPYTTLHEWFEAQVHRTPDAVALTCESQSLTYRELNLRANRLAHALRERGVGPDVIVGLCLERSLELVISLLGILKAGGAYLPVDLSYPKDRLAFMLEDAAARFLVTQSKLAADLPVHGAEVISVDDAGLSAFQSYPTSNPSSAAASNTLAYVIYTSGTTGKSKGALITHRNVTRLFTATEAWYGFNASDVWTLFHSTAFDFSVWELWGALLYGGRVIVVPFLVSRSPEAFYELLARERVTVLNQTPSAFRQLIHAEDTVGRKPLALRYVIFGGEALEMHSLRPWFERHGDHMPRLVNMYGITETTVHVTYRPLSKNDLDSGSVIGIPIPDLQVYILDERKQPVPIGVAGEMYIGGAGLSRGYLHRPELTEERFIPDHLGAKSGVRLYKTGDLARFLPGRDIEYLGRIDHQVKIRGFRIELGEIESVLCQHPAVREAVVIAREDVPGVKTLAAYVVASTSSAPALTVLREHLKRKLPDYMVPAAFVFLDKLPLTHNGKVDRRALPDPGEQRPDVSGRYVAPRTELEEKLAAIWAKVLRVERVGVHDNFFELGGDSILSIQAISLARRGGMMLTAKHMFAHQTIADLAGVVGVQEEVASDCAPAEGNVRLTPIQHWWFEQNLERMEHYNQALLLEVLERLDRGLLERALHALAHQHDALRFRYTRDDRGWRQYYSVVEEAVPLKWTPIAELDEAVRLQTIEAAVASAHSSLNLEHGPLWRVVYFDAGYGQSGRLLFVVHHLAIDGVSWRPLLEDLETAYQQVKDGQAVQLPSKTASFKAWADDLHEFAKTDTLGEELSYWKAVTKLQSSAGGTESATSARKPALNKEGSAKTVTVSLTRNETEALLHDVPSVYNTHINDVLLTALTRAWGRCTGAPALTTNVEGHGREQLLRHLDLSRTVGWFTSIFPVRLELTTGENDWDPGEALKSIKEQLRKVPRRGIGYGLLRYLGRDSELSLTPEPSVVFNYFGQFDQVLAGSKLFRFAAESAGPWHSPTQERRYSLEINSMVIDGCLQSSWTYSPNLHSDRVIRDLTGEFSTALKELIRHCQLPNVGGRTPSDFPLSGLDQAALDRLLCGRTDIEDAYCLSPIQSLFYSVNPGRTVSEFDQWQCSLRGPLDLTAFQRAWDETVHRHTILRSTIHGEGLSEPVQLVHKEVQLPWVIEDWRELSSQEQTERWSRFLANDRGRPLTLTEAPAMRFGLVRLSEDAWRFVWSVPALLLDGWSWPIVFREASRLYDAFSSGHSLTLEPPRPYRDYIEWVGKHSSKEARSFWQSNLKGFRTPTLLPTELPERNDGNGDRNAEYTVPLSPNTTGVLQATARQLQVTLSTLVQAAWTLLLVRQSGSNDVMFGAAFAGRPVELRGAEAIVGPFVNNVPVRLQSDPDTSLREFIKSVHSHLLELSAYQYTPLLEIQDCSEMPWQFRPFDSLVVFQNYLVDEAARRLGRRVEIGEFKGPIHTNYPLLLLAEPEPVLTLRLIYDRQHVAHAAAERWGRDLALLMEGMPALLDRLLREVEEKLSPPAVAGARPRKRMYAVSQNFVPPQNEMESSIATVWQKMFGLERVSVEENLFDLGGHSLLLVHMHQRLRGVVKREFPLVTLFMHPTIRSLARYFQHGEGELHTNGEERRSRAERQKAALAQLRTKRGKLS